MCRGPEPEFCGFVSSPYSHAYFDVSGMVLLTAPLTYTLIELSVPSGMENRATSVLVAARVVHWTYAPVWFNVTALRPDASPARSPTVRFGPTTAAPPPVWPSSASYMSYGMLAPRPTKNDLSLVLFACLTASSLASTATTVGTVYLSFAAVQVPRLIAGDEAPAARVPVYEPVSVFTVEEPLRIVTVTLCAPPAVAAVPWFFSVTEKVTVLPAAGLPGDQVTAEAIRSELLTGVTTRLAGL